MLMNHEFICDEHFNHWRLYCLDLLLQMNHEFISAHRSS
jgi:hypothetical protein